ncbi:MAG: carboxypeptidase M32 [Erysipelotrichaceae bacterium]|nr:carboxypeptidase M32 [Erysipelotrichaceae bacterium]
MDVETKLNQFREISEKISAYRLALTTLNWDSSTIAPKKGASYRNKMAALLSGELFSIETSPEFIALIDNLSAETLDDITTREVREIKKNLDKSRYIPKEVFIEYAQLTRDAENVWEAARDHEDYESFKPYLKKLIDMTKKVVSYRKDDRPVYEQLIDDFETGITIADYDVFFNKLKAEIVPFLHKIISKKIEQPAWLRQNVSIEQQRQVVEVLMEYLNYDKGSGYIGESAHPFSSHFSVHDNRVTVRYLEDMFTSSIFALIHEVGHATYNGQVDEAYQGRAIADSMTYGMHESQSRLYENMLGRSKAFWSSIYPKVQAIVNNLKDISLDDFILGVNHVELSLIRIEADELTYPLHIMIRYEIEQGLFNGTLDVEGLDKVWSDKYEEYLGIRPPHNGLGILQDIHWSGGAFGYFPTYALGSAYSAQWMSAMRKEIDVDQCLKNNDFKSVNDWLKNNVHRHGGVYQPNELLLSVTGEPFNPQYYIEYLKQKYSQLFEVSE